MERGQTYRTNAGDLLVPSDNGPAWWMHHVAFNGLRPRDFSQMPTRMFEVGRVARVNVNTAGWHVAHTFDAKDRNTDWQNCHGASWVKRFVRDVHPCNCFYVSKPR
jgi:hypothetical protein